MNDGRVMTHTIVALLCFLCCAYMLLPGTISVWPVLAKIVMFGSLIQLILPLFPTRDRHFVATAAGRHESPDKWPTSGGDERAIQTD